MHEVLRFFRGLGGALVLLVALSISLYGVLTLDSARVHYTTAGNPAMLDKVAALRDAGDAGGWPQSPAEVAGYASGFITLLGVVSTPRHAFGTDSLGAHALVYASAPKLNASPQDFGSWPSR